MIHPAVAAGRTAGITGAASGVGLAAARALAAKGTTIAMLDLPGLRLEAAAATLKGSRAIPQDVSDALALGAAAATIAKEMPPTTLVFNSAGFGVPSSALANREAWDRTMAVNFGGILTVAQALIPRMLAHSIQAAAINTGSKQGITIPPGNPAYNVSKTNTESLAHEVRNLPGASVSVHLMTPSWVHTGLTAAEGAPKPAGAWTAEEAVDFMLASLARADFYILCPDNDVSRELDERRIAWATSDIIENRPPLSRWHPDWVDAFRRIIEYL